MIDLCTMVSIIMIINTRITGFCTWFLGSFGIQGGILRYFIMYINRGMILQGVCDGASALVLANEAAIKRNNLTPLARLVAYGISGNFIFVKNLQMKSK